MNDPTWIRELARAAKDEAEAERAELEGPWDRLTDGELTVEEVGELQRSAETSPEALEAYEAFRPLGPEFKEKALAAVREGLKAGRVEPRPIRPVPPVEPVVPAPVAPVPLPDPLHFEPRPAPAAEPVRRPWARRWGGWVAAAAAALIFALIPPWAPKVGPWVATETQGGDVGERSGEATLQPDEPALYHDGSQFSIALASQSGGKRCEPDLVAECFLAGSAELRPWPGCGARARFDSCGHRGTLGGTVGTTVPLEPGSWRLWVLIGRRGKLPGVEKLQEDLQGDSSKPCPKMAGTRRRNWSAVCVQRLRMENGP